jgi:hypothetical protein
MSRFVCSWHEVDQAADIIERHDIPLDIGPSGRRRPKNL